MVSPEQDHVVRPSVEGLERVTRGLGKVAGPQVLEALDKTRQNLVASRHMVRMSEDLDVWMQCLEGMLGVLQGSG